MSLKADETRELLSILLNHAPSELRHKILDVITARMTEVVNKVLQERRGPVNEAIKTYVEELVKDALELKREDLKAEVLRQLPTQFDKLTVTAVEAAYKAAIKGMAESIAGKEKERY